MNHLANTTYLNKLYDIVFLSPSRCVLSLKQYKITMTYDCVARAYVVITSLARSRSVPYLGPTYITSRELGGI